MFITLQYLNLKIYFSLIYSITCEIIFLFNLKAYLFLIIRRQKFCTIVFLSNFYLFGIKYKIIDFNLFFIIYVINKYILIKLTVKYRKNTKCKLKKINY